MKTIIFVSDKEVRRSMVDPLSVEVMKELKGQATFAIVSVDQGTFTAKRTANKIVNDYAVTQLPFVLLTDGERPEGEQEYAAVYSEEGPITVERIKAKL